MSEMVDGKLQPNKEGLGLGKVLDYIGKVVKKWTKSGILPM